MFCSHWKVANIKDYFRVKFSLRVKCLGIKVKIHRRKTKADAKAVYTNTICVSFCWHLFHTRYPVLDTAIQILQKELWAVLYQVPIILKSFQRLMLPFHSLRLLIKYFSTNSHTITFPSRCHLYNLKYYLGPVYTKHQSQRCNNSVMMLVIMFSLKKRRHSRMGL